MSRDNVEIVRRIIGAFNQGGADAGLDFYDPEIEFHEDPKFPEAEVYRGREAVAHYFREFGASFDSYRFEIEELRDAGGDKVMSIVRERARGRVSGLEVDRRSGWVTTLREGKVVCLEIYLDPADALVAAGLRE
jgi:ketosteroid isomerase-like protein